MCLSCAKHLFTEEHNTISMIIIPLMMCSDHIYYEPSSMLLLVSVGLGAGETATIVVVPMVCITVVALFLYKKYYQQHTADGQISKEPEDKVERKKPNNLSSSTKVTSSQLIVGGNERKRKQKKKRKSTNRTSPSLVLQPIQ